MDDASAELAKLQEARARATARVDGLEADWRAAVTAAQDASAALAHAERVGVSESKRSTLEERLAAAKARAAEPWAERVEGSRAAVRDADRAVSAFVNEHFSELLEAKEADGRIAAEKEDVAAAAQLAAYRQREAVAAEIASLASLVSTTAPGDVTYSKADELARAAVALIEGGGEEPPRLRRDREPWATLLAQPAPEAVSA
jgi:hypothetical protein